MPKFSVYCLSEKPVWLHNISSRLFVSLRYCAKHLQKEPWENSHWKNRKFIYFSKILVVVVLFSSDRRVYIFFDIWKDSNDGSSKFCINIKIMWWQRLSKWVVFQPYRQHETWIVVNSTNLLPLEQWQTKREKKHSIQRGILREHRMKATASIGEYAAYKTRERLCIFQTSSKYSVERSNRVWVHKHTAHVKLHNNNKHR